MKQNINTALLVISSICLLKIAFWEEILLVREPAVAAYVLPEERAKLETQSIQDVRVWNGASYDGKTVPLLVQCNNCR